MQQEENVKYCFENGYLYHGKECFPTIEDSPDLVKNQWLGFDIFQDYNYNYSSGSFPLLSSNKLCYEKYSYSNQCIILIIPMLHNSDISFGTS
jgi:hypothetical protein